MKSFAIDWKKNKNIPVCYDIWIVSLIVPSHHNISTSLKKCMHKIYKADNYFESKYMYYKKINLHIMF